MFACFLFVFNLFVVFVFVVVCVVLAEDGLLAREEQVLLKQSAFSLKIKS